MEQHSYGIYSILVDAGRWTIVNDEGVPMASGEGGKRDAVDWMAHIVVWLVDVVKRQEHGPLQ